MTDADTDEIITVASDAVTVEKSFEPDDFPVPAIAFSIQSDRDTDVSVRLVDTVPDDVAPENIGFHPKYGAEFWSVENGQIVFQRDLSAGEEYTTVYGLRGGNADTAAKFMSEPILESVEPPTLDDSDEVDSALETAVPDDVSTSEDDTPEENATETDDSPPSAIASEIALSNGPSADDPEPGNDGSVSLQGGEGSLIEALAAEIREGDTDDDDIMELRDALGLDLATASVEARIEHLQSSVADFEAYTESLEAFLDQEGDAQTLISETRDRYEEVDERIEELEGQVSELRSDLDDRPTDIEAVVDERVDAELQGIRSELGEIAERLEDEGEAREEIRSDLEDLSSELADVAEMRDRLTSALGGLAGGASPDGDDVAEPEAEDDDPKDSDEGDEPDADAKSDENEKEAEAANDEDDADVDDTN